MEYYIILLISFLGIPSGWFLNKVAEGEVEQYSKVIMLLKELVVLSIFGMVIFFTGRIIESLVLFLAYQVLGFLGRRDLQYSSLSAPLWLAYPLIFPLTAILCFVAGIFYGAFSKAEDGLKGALILVGNYSGFLLIGVLLGIIS